MRAWQQHAASRTSAALTARRRAPRQFQRKDPVGKNRKPVMVHINYHPDKACVNLRRTRQPCARLMRAPIVRAQWERMKAVIRRWVDGDTRALDSFPVRSGAHARCCIPASYRAIVLRRMAPSDAANRLWERKQSRVPL